MTINDYAACKLVKFKDYDRFATVKRKSHGTIFIDQKNLVAVKKPSFHIGFFELLTIVFIILKLCKVINWSWLWVLSPIWIQLALALMIIGIIYLISSIIYLWAKLF